jgi:4-hydroxybenzoate polyprenyltransferase
MEVSEVFWLIYRKTRPALGIPFAFVLMSFAFFGIFNLQMIITAFGFFFIDLFGNFYNDHCDFREDVENGRMDKFTTSGVIDIKTAMRVSIIFALSGIGLLLLTSLSLLALGVFYAFLLFAYSYKGIRLKGKISGYALVSSPYIFLPVIIAEIYGFPLFDALFLSLFFYFQCMYILSQKDSTDTKDRENLFTKNGWKKSSNMVTLFAALSSVSLLSVSVYFFPLVLVWILNLFSKLLNVNKIRKNTITRSERSRFVLVEFLTPYLFALGGLI